jgi:hypothetical protein
MTRYFLHAALAGLLCGAASAQPYPDDAALKDAALRIDRQVATFYRNRKLPVPEVTNDATFLRRAFLVAIGRIPTSEESLAFLELGDADKREQLIAYLLKSPGYSSHMANWAFDLLRVVDHRAGSSAGHQPYRHWVRTAIAGNMPWDELTRRLIASHGDGWDPETAAVGYYTRDRGMPLDNLSNTMRIFLAERMECAQCHDDPFGTTDRHEFYQLAAFTHGQEPMHVNAMQRLFAELRDGDRANTDEYGMARVIMDGVYALSLDGGGAGRISLPSDYQYRDAKPGDVVGGRTPFGKTVRMNARRDENNGREKLAEWITGRTDQRFPAVIANRMWKRVMGRALHEPVDEYVMPSKTHHPPLATLLAELMVEFKYDLRAFQHALLFTRTFQFATNPNPSSVEGGDDFHGRKIQRLSSEQIWDSLITLAAGDPDKTPTAGLDDTIYLNGRPVLQGRKTMTELSREVLAIKTEPEMRRYFNNLVADLRKGGSPGEASMMAMNRARRHGDNALARASELPSPAPRDHLLYLFGASDREVVEASSREPNVGQVLSLMNGFVQDRLVNHAGAHLYRSIDGVKADREKIRRLHIAILSRPPSDQEMAWMLEELSGRGPEEGCRNIVSALIMSSEFLFLQ